MLRLGGMAAAGVAGAGVLSAANAWPADATTGNVQFGAEPTTQALQFDTGDAIDASDSAIGTARRSERISTMRQLMVGDPRLDGGKRKWSLSGCSFWSAVSASATSGSAWMLGKAKAEFQDGLANKGASEDKTSSRVETPKPIVPQKPSTNSSGTLPPQVESP